MPFPWSDLGKPPSAATPEVSVFGPGYGECVLVHYGDGLWLIVDSCIDDETKESVALSYLKALGVSPSAVRLIVATHWHDDHVRGLATVVSACTSAKFVCAPVLTEKDFYEFVAQLSANNMAISGSGVSEFRRVHEILADARRPKVKAGPDRRLLHVSEENSSIAFELWSLSPSDEEFERFMKFMAAEVINPGDPKRRAATAAPNDTSIVLLTDWGDSAAALLGSDLESYGSASNTRGWGAIVTSQGRPKKKSNFVKVPHHGGKSAHHPQMWSSMLTERPTAVLTPFARGSGLPTLSDIERILTHTPHAYSTALRGSVAVKFENPVERSLAEAKIKIKRAPRMGLVRTRFVDREWRVELFQHAHILTKHVAP